MPMKVLANFCLECTTFGCSYTKKISSRNLANCLANNLNQAAQIGRPGPKREFGKCLCSCQWHKNYARCQKATAVGRNGTPRRRVRFGQIQFEMRVTYGWNETAAGQMLSVKILLGHTHREKERKREGEWESDMLENFKCENRLCFGIRICKMCVRRRE